MLRQQFSRCNSIRESSMEGHAVMNYTSGSKIWMQNYVSGRTLVIS